jgi:hypothetical protein
MTALTPREIAEAVADDVVEEICWLPSMRKWQYVRDAVLHALVHSRLEQEIAERDLQPKDYFPFTPKDWPT